MMGEEEKPDEASLPEDSGDRGGREEAGDHPGDRGQGEESAPPGDDGPEPGPEGQVPEEADDQGGAWDGSAAQVPGQEESAADRDAADAQEEPPDYDGRTSQYRRDFPRGRQVGNAAGRDAFTAGRDLYILEAERRERPTPGRVSVSDLRHVVLAHVPTAPDETLGRILAEHQVVFFRGRPGTGRSDSATAELDRLTGYSRSPGKVIVLDGAAGPEAALSQVEEGNGYLLDLSESPWAGAMSKARLAQAREALGRRGFLVILLDSDATGALPGPVTDHEKPDLGRVAAFHLAVRLVGDDVDRPAVERAESWARAVIEEACQSDGETRDWYREITTAATASPADAVLFAAAIWDWHNRGSRDVAPRVTDYRGRRRYEQAASLLRRHDGTDSPLRQSYAIAAAVLDGLALNEIIDGAGKLGVLLDDVEHPGEPGQREIFGQPLARWLRHVDIVPADPGWGDKGGTLVRMPSRELARTVIELAWREYDAARTPILTWLTGLCEQHRDDRVRIRAVQALAFIAAYDYALVKERVLDVWSDKESRKREQLSASWLLEAIVLDGTSAQKVYELLKKWSRSPELGKRRVAVRAYGTAISLRIPKEAIAGVRFLAVFPDLGWLPELAMRDMYLLGPVKAGAAGRLPTYVMEELVEWMHGFPLMRDRASRAVLWISRVMRVTEGESEGPYDLLWRLTHVPGEVGASLPQIARLLRLACTSDSSHSDTWKMLGDWSQSCRDDPRMRDTFEQLIDELGKAVANDDELRKRLDMYRRWWKS